MTLTFSVKYIVLETANGSSKRPRKANILDSYIFSEILYSFYSRNYVPFYSKEVPLKCY